jgi:hypothetical protein
VAPPPPGGGVPPPQNVHGGTGLVGSSWKTDNLLGPPQYSVLLPLQVILHPLMEGSDEASKVALFEIEFAQ